MYTLGQIAEITDLKFSGSGNQAVNYFLNDSRALQSPEDTLFIALRSGRNNGHAFIPGLVEKGVRSFLVNRTEFDTSPYDKQDVSFIFSDDPLKTIQKLAAYHRQRFSLPVIGITGSNGKTVVKEWLYQLLKENYVICRSPKSYNSQIGVPLSVLNLNSTHTLAIFEAGISRPGEMEMLASIIRPTMGVFTSLGQAHDEGFSNRREKLSEKMKLFEAAETIIINGIDKKEKIPEFSGKETFVSESEDADLRIKTEDHLLSLVGNSKTYNFKIPFTDKASVYNAATCATVLLKMGIGENRISAGLAALQPLALRLEIKNGINNSMVINDYYNSDLDSMKIALNYLQQQNRRGAKMVIVSDIEQSGIPSGELYRQLAGLFSQNKIDLVIGIGKQISAHKSDFPPGSHFFNDTATFTAVFPNVAHLFSDASILLKGARSFGFENISRLLQLKSHDTVFEIDLNKLTANINYFRSLVKPGVKLMCMVKAMGYGSGSSEIAKTLQHIGVNYLAVAYTDEGVELRQSQVSLPIMVMSPEEDAFEDIVNHRLEPEIYNFRTLRLFASKLDSLGITEPFPVHVKIDTGMHRLGFDENELEQMVKELKGFPQLKVRSVFSHLVGSDNEALDDFTKEQTRIFEKAFAMIEKELGYPVLKHICNSGGISRFKNSHYDMVRLGIGMYGIGVNREEQKHLENVGVLKTQISQIKNVAKGKTVGYNRSGKMERDSNIATIPIGYADGFSRALGNGKHGVYIKGKFCRTVGNICMDMCMIDVTGIDCSEGDEAIIFENVTQINALSRTMNTISYEVLTNVSARVKRVYLQE